MWPGSFGGYERQSLSFLAPILRVPYAKQVTDLLRITIVTGVDQIPK